MNTKFTKQLLRTTLLFTLTVFLPATLSAQTREDVARYMVSAEQGNAMSQQAMNDLGETW